MFRQKSVCSSVGVLVSTSPPCAHPRKKCSNNYPRRAEPRSDSGRLQPEVGNPSVGGDPPTAAIGKGGPSRTPVPILDLGDACSSDVAGAQRVARQVEVGDVIAAAAAALEQVGMGLSNS